MRLLYCDETNLEYQDGGFFIYGGLSIPGDNAFELSEKVRELKKASKIPDDFNIKLNPGPCNMSHQEFIELKQNIIIAAIEAECELHVSMILHNISTGSQQARLNEINRVIFQFNTSLVCYDDVGLVLLDRFSDASIDAHVREKFLVGLNMPYNNKFKINRILGIHYSAIGQSYFSSVMDIIIGSLRFCINAHTHHKEQSTDSCATILRLLSPLFSRDPSNLVPERNLFFSPKIIRVPKYREQYESLKAFLAAEEIIAAQIITNVRTY